MPNDMRDRLIELLRNSGASFERALPEEIADHLIANGVILPPCKVGDKIYWAGKGGTGVEEFVVTSINAVVLKDIDGISIDLQFAKLNGHREFNYQFPAEWFGECVFLTKEEAEKALKERGGDNNG